MFRRYPRVVPRGFLWLVVCLLLAAGSWPLEALAQQGGRDAWQRVPDVISALAIGPGSRVADVGAGSGYFTGHLARAVGPDGRVFAVEISVSELSRLRRLAEGETLSNIEVVEGEIDDPRLPGRSLNAVLVVDAYHEMTEYEAMLAGMYGALRPGGRLVILDLEPGDGSASRDRQTGSHRISLDLAASEVRAAGFEVLERISRFVTNERGRRQWMLIARRPGGQGDTDAGPRQSASSPENETP